MRKLAENTSIILAPVLVVFLIFIFCFSSGLSISRGIVFFLMLFIFQFLIPFGYAFSAAYFGKVTSWDFQLKEERMLSFFLHVTGWLVLLAFTYFYGNPFLLKLELISLVLTLLYWVVTLFWKISLHVALCTAASVLITYRFGSEFWPIYLTIPIVMWARHELGRHTWPQMILSAFLSAGCMAGMLTYL